MHVTEALTPQDKYQLLRNAAERLRKHSLETTSRAGSGHPTSCLSCAEIMSVIFFEHMRMDTENPHNLYTDRFVLSKGHAAPILWSTFHEAGLLSRQEINSLRQLDSEQEGHPTPRNRWIDAATGSLGQGLSMALGMAWSATSRKTDARVFVLMGDGETAEGSVWEAAALASHLGLGNLVAVVDINRYGQSGATMLGHDIDAYRKRFEAFDWHVQTVDGHDVESLSRAFGKALADEQRPSVILAKTEKGKGVSALEGEKGSHGKPAGDLEEALAALDQNALNDKQRLEIHPVGRQLDPPVLQLDGPLPSEEYSKGDSVATRSAFGQAMVALGRICPDLAALDGDVKNSTRLEAFFEAYPDRSIECYIAEQNMIDMAIGIGKSGWLPCLATFAAFLTRAYDQLRMAAISQCRLVVAGSHAGVAIGEDGPTQMGLEDLAMMRALPESMVLYPCDGPSTVSLLLHAARHERVAYLRLTRGSTPVIYASGEDFLPGGCRVWNESPDDAATLIGAGVTLHECLKAQQLLKKQGIAVRVIDCYSVKPIDAETLRRCTRETGALMVVEDHYPEGGIGEAVLSALEGTPCRWRHLAIREIPRSGPPDALLERFGISADPICDAVKMLL